MSSRPTELPAGKPRREVVGELAEAFRRQDVPAVLLRAPGVEAGAAGAATDGTWRHDLDVLVPRSAREAADRAVDGLGWRIAIGGRGAWSQIPTVSYHWEFSPSLDLHRGFPAGPLPPGSLRRLGLMLMERARATACGIPAPDAGALAVFSAIQAARPGPFREMWVRDVGAHLDASAPGEAERVANELGVRAALRWAASSSDAMRLPTGRAGPVFDGIVRRVAWSALTRVRRAARPRRLGTWMGGIPRPGATIARSRFGGLELLSGPGAFTPQPVTEPMIDVALAGLPERGGILVDVGTGVGAVALAVGRTRPDVQVIGCDVSKAGLRWAERNRERLGLANVRFLRGSLLEPLGEDLAERADVITGNVPYVPERAFGQAYRDRDGTVLGQGVDGLDLQRELVRTSTMFLAPKGRLIVQSSIDQWEFLATEMAGWGFAPQPMAASSFEDAICWGIADARRGRPFGLFLPDRPA